MTVSTHSSSPDAGTTTALVSGPAPTESSWRADVPAPTTVLRKRDGDRGVSRAERSARTAALLEQSQHVTDEDAHRRILDEVVVLNRGVAHSVASRYLGRGISKEDLEQVACEALIKAVRRFDPTTGNDLLTYAVPTIRGELLRHFRDFGWSVRPPRRLQELQRKLAVAISQLEQELGREPTDREVQEALEVTDVEYQEAVEAFGCFQPVSLDQPAAAESTASLGDFLPEDDTDATTSAAEARVVLSPVVRRLGDRDQQILKLRFVDDLTQREIGARLGVTQMQVSRLLAGIIGRLRADLEQGPEDRSRLQQAG